MNEIGLYLTDSYEREGGLTGMFDLTHFWTQMRLSNPSRYREPD